MCLSSLLTTQHTSWLCLSAACLSAACREWLRHQKTLRLPEQRASQSQLARIRELQLPLTDAAAATLTSAQVRGLWTVD